MLEKCDDNRPVEPAADEGKSSRFRTMVYLTEAELTQLDELKGHFRRQEQRKVDQSQLVREAIRHYHEALLGR
jgi:hypothetical protein